MSGGILDLIDRLAQRRSARAWSRAGGSAGRIDLAALRGLRTRALQARRGIDEVVKVADERLAEAAGAAPALRGPLHADWVWRPRLWAQRLDPVGIAAVENRTQYGDATFFHDCRTSELTIRQIRNRRDRTVAPYGLRMEVFGFDGSFLSLVIDLPAEALAGLKLRHLVRMDCAVEVEKPIQIFVRLNIQHGPNTEQLVRELPVSGGEASVEFDLAYTKLNEKRVEKAWIDLIFEQPGMNQIVLRDATFARRPRAEL